MTTDNTGQDNKAVGEWCDAAPIYLNNQRVSIYANSF